MIADLTLIILANLHYRLEHGEWCIRARLIDRIVIIIIRT